MAIFLMGVVAIAVIIFSGGGDDPPPPETETTEVTVVIEVVPASAAKTTTTTGPAPEPVSTKTSLPFARPAEPEAPAVAPREVLCLSSKSACKKAKTDVQSKSDPRSGTRSGKRNGH